jgi:hypothetical protein
MKETDYWQRLLRMHEEGPHGSRAAECEYQFSPPDADCHATFPGVMQLRRYHT